VKYVTFCRRKFNGASIDQSLELIGDSEAAKRPGSLEEDAVFTLMTSEICIKTHKI